jgi:multiple sugar transport system substrate-binding protein
MKMKRRTILKAGLAVPVTLAIGRAGYAAAPPMPMILWHSEARPTRIKAIQDLCAAFNQSQNLITITPENQDYSNVYMKISAAIQAGRPPDMLFTTPDISMLVQSAGGTIQDVSAEVARLGQMYRIDPSTLRPFTWNGKYWSVPLYNMAEVLWYRTDLFRKAGLDPSNPPKTWSALFSTAQTLVSKGVVKFPIGVAGDLHLATMQQVYPLMCTAKAEDLFDSKGNVVFDNPNTVRAYDMYLRLFKMSPPGSETWQWDQPLNALIAGDIAMVIEKGQYIEQWDLRTTQPPELLGAGPVPIPDTGGQHATATWDNGILLLNATRQARLGFDAFLDYLYTPENMGRLVGVGPGLFLPVTQEAATAKSLHENATLNRHFAAFSVEIQEERYGRQLGFTTQPFNKDIGRITGQNLLAWVAQQMTINGLSPAAAVKAGQQKILESLT